MNPSEFTDTVLSNTSTLDKVAFFDEFAYGEIVFEIGRTDYGLLAAYGLVATDRLIAADRVIAFYCYILSEGYIATYGLRLGAILYEKMLIEGFDLLGYIAGGGEGGIARRLIIVILRSGKVGDDLVANTKSFCKGCQFFEDGGSGYLDGFERLLYPDEFIHSIGNELEHLLEYGVSLLIDLLIGAQLSTYIGELSIRSSLITCRVGSCYRTYLNIVVGIASRSRLLIAIGILTLDGVVAHGEDDISGLTGTRQTCIDKVGRRCSERGGSGG